MRTASSTLLLSFAAYEFERLWNKVVPGIFKSVLVGMLTMGCTYVLTMVVLAPLGTWIGEGIVFVLMAIYSIVGPVALAVLAASLLFPSSSWSASTRSSASSWFSFSRTRPLPSGTPAPQHG